VKARQVVKTRPVCGDGLLPEAVVLDVIINAPLIYLELLVLGN
jgi:hypothetical protein